MKKFTILKNFLYGSKMFYKELIGKSDYWHPKFPYRNCKPEEYKVKYFIDFSEKAKYPLELKKGIPIINLKGVDYEFSITIINYGLGLIDLDYNKNKKEILIVYEWIESNLSKNGGIKNLTPLPRYGLEKGWYSCLTQGLVLSFLARCINLHIIDKNRAIPVMDLVYDFMKHPSINQRTKYGNILQEFESSETSVLNGYIFGIFGLYDYGLLKNDFYFFQIHINTLKKVLSRYEMKGGWSYYNLKGVVASRFYHSLHVNMLKSLFIITGDIYFKKLSQHWQKGYKYKIIYLFYKSIQKLKTIKHIHVLQN
jgi:heparosan-N-sulfate-glucuronate 5-epimerase